MNRNTSASSSTALGSGFPKPPSSALAQSSSSSKPKPSGTDKFIHKPKPTSSSYPVHSTEEETETVNRPREETLRKQVITEHQSAPAVEKVDRSKFIDEDFADEPEDKRRYHEEEEEPEPVSRYKISNLISLFNKNGIELQTIFTHHKRVMMVQVLQEGFSYFVYIPSKYEMYIDRSLGIATYEMSDDDEQQEEDQDTLFYNKLPIQNLRRAKTSKSKSLLRFLPLVTESPIKMMYIDEYFVTYISRHNEVDSLILLSPFKASPGYFFLTDLEFFFKNLTKIIDELGKFERAFNEAVYNRLSVEVDTATASIAKAQKLVASLQPKKEKKEFVNAVTKLYKYSTEEKHREKALKMLVSIRNRNLNKIFDIENVTYVMKEFK